MSKHTPGPWFLKNRNEIHDKEMRQDESGAWIGDRPNLIATVDLYNTEPNARLIAAAPDLLEALVAALPYIEGAYECAFPDALKNGAVLANARAAIAKATGAAE